jgi:hypothetical protein
MKGLIYTGLGKVKGSSKKDGELGNKQVWEAIITPKPEAQGRK